MESLYLDANLRLESTHPLADANHAILGVPADYTQTSRVGARHGPLEIRRAFLEIEKNWDEISFHDLGNLVPVLGDMRKTCERLATLLSEVKAESKAIPILLGGEHTISWGAVKTLKPEVVVWLDAHADVRDEYLNQKFCHASVARRILEDFNLELIQVGVRSKSKDEEAYGEKEGVQQLNADDIKEIKNKIRDKKIYVSTDLDVLDPSIAPGVGNPEPGGLSFNTLTSLYHTILESSTVVGADLVEACPELDHGQTATITANLLLQILTSK
ncbi:MAG: agmatinase [Methanobacteriota archaeon]